jgi:hypothetical protein
VATFTGRLELHLSSPYTLPWCGKEELLRLSFTIDVVQLIELLKHFSTSLSLCRSEETLEVRKKGCKEYKDVKAS